MMKKRIRGGERRKGLQISDDFLDTVETDSEDEEMRGDETSDIDLFLELLHDYSTAPEVMQIEQIILPTPNSTLLNQLKNVFDQVSRENHQHVLPLFLVFRTREGIVLTIISDIIFCDELNDALKELNDMSDPPLFDVVRQRAYDTTIYNQLIRGRATWIDIGMQRCRNCVNYPENLDYVRRDRERELARARR